MSELAVDVAGIPFRNPIVLAAGTAAFGRSLDGVIHLQKLGGITTKAVSLEPRHGNAAPRVAEFTGGMLNAVGLANPGVDEVRRSELPWLAQNAANTRVIVNVVGSRVEDFAAVIRELDDSAGITAYELNVSCPNVRSGGAEFCFDNDALTGVVRGAREATSRPLFVKLSPMLPDIAATAIVARDAGVDGITVVNTIPGLAIEVTTRRSRIGFGSGGTSGAALLPVGVLATYRVSRAVPLPVIGVGGVGSAEDALQYIIAGASLVGIGTAALRDPRVPERIVRQLENWCNAHRVERLRDLRGTLEWQT